MLVNREGSTRDVLLITVKGSTGINWVPGIQCMNVIQWLDVHNCYGLSLCSCYLRPRSTVCVNTTNVLFQAIDPNFLIVNDH